MTKQLKKNVIIPESISGELPSSYAERLAQFHISTTDDTHRKKIGFYFTPVSIARYMGGLCRNGERHFIRVLDPASGTGILACAACEAYAQGETELRHIELVCYELDHAIADLLVLALENLRVWLWNKRKIRLRYRIEVRDFILANAQSLEPQLFAGTESLFDGVICNPPYFKISKSDKRAIACSSIVHGQPNIYGLFMAVGAAMLRDGGRFVFITPRSFSSGPYFSRFRDFFFNLIRPTDIHIFESRADAFFNVLQETVITAGSRAKNWERSTDKKRIRLTASTGAIDINNPSTRMLPLSEVLEIDCNQRLLHFPASKEHDRVRKMFHMWKGNLHEFGWEISTGPVVAFRAKKYLRSESTKRATPLLWLQNVRVMEIRWPVSARKPQYISSGPETSNLTVPNRNYVVLRRFSAKEEKQRITAAPYLAKQNSKGQIALENHLNFIHKPQGELSVLETYGLAAFLNSKLANTYFRISSGNTQVSATEMRAIRLPPIAALRSIGRRIKKGEDFDAAVNVELGYVP